MGSARSQSEHRTKGAEQKIPLHGFRTYDSINMWICYRKDATMMRAFRLSSAISSCGKVGALVLSIGVALNGEAFAQCAPKRLPNGALSTTWCQRHIEKELPPIPPSSAPNAYINTVPAPAPQYSGTYAPTVPVPYGPPVSPSPIPYAPPANPTYAYSPPLVSVCVVSNAPGEFCPMNQVLPAGSNCECPGSDGQLYYGAVYTGPAN
jgi:hypothetical protein